eukprot:6405222-Amphidinium_carterae.1
MARTFSEKFSGVLRSWCGGVQTQPVWEERIQKPVCVTVLKHSGHTLWDVEALVAFCVAPQAPPTVTQGSLKLAHSFRHVARIVLDIEHHSIAHEAVAWTWMPRTYVASALSILIHCIIGGASYTVLDVIMWSQMADCVYDWNKKQDTVANRTPFCCL